jgi:hypothetical protein
MSDYEGAQAGYNGRLYQVEQSGKRKLTLPAGSNSTRWFTQLITAT